jgi:YVTN family beta-propeller protein
MQNNIRIKRIWFFLCFLFAVLKIFVVILPSNNIYAQFNDDLHSKTLYEIAKNATLNKSASIAVGHSPRDIDIYGQMVYVANSDDNTVSVIDATNNTKIADINVGRMPSAIGINFDNNKIYVANTDDNTVSVIDPTTNTKIADINVGRMPSAIGVINNKIYVANTGDNTVSVINATNNTKIADIEVGKGPLDIGVINNKIYVANFGTFTYTGNTVSVINATSNTKMADINVGRMPSAIGVVNGMNGDKNTIYVANTGDNTVSVIDPTTNTKIADINVGRWPSDIQTYSSLKKENDIIKEYISLVYVAYNGDNTVSVINATSNTKIADIEVGKGPSAIATLGMTIYAAKSEENAVYVIDGKSNKVVARVLFNVEPFNSGHIECDRLIAPLLQQFYLYDGAKCIAKPSQGFEFVSWQENLKGNSTQMLQVAPAPSVWDSILDMFHMKPDKPEATLAISKFGSFTANFRALPPPVPPEYWTTLFGFVLSTILGTVLIPTFLVWRKSKSQGNKLEYYHYQISGLYDDGRLDENDMDKLDSLRKSITDEYAKGKITKEQFEKLINEISINYREIFNNELDSLYNLSEYDKENLVVKIKSDIEDAYAKEKINDLHYNLLQKKLLKYEK